MNVAHMLVIEAQAGNKQLFHTTVPTHVVGTVV
jgi:hypothetical protein